MCFLNVVELNHLQTSSVWDRIKVPILRRFVLNYGCRDSPGCRDSRIPLVNRGSLVNCGNLSLSISRLSCILSLSVAAKHDSRNIKNNLKLILGFLDRGCRVSRLPGNTISSLYRGCRKVPQQVDTHVIIRSPLVSRFLFCLIYKIVVRSSK